MASVEMSDGVFGAAVTVIGLLLTGGIAAVGWTVSLLWRTTVSVGRLEERLDDLEVRVAKCDDRYERAHP